MRDTWPVDYDITEEDTEQAERERQRREGFAAFCDSVEDVRGRE